METTIPTTISSPSLLDTLIQQPYFVPLVFVAIIALAIFLKVAFIHPEKEYKYKPDEE